MLYLAGICDDDPMYVPDLLVDLLRDEGGHGFTVVGGRDGECITEVEIVLDALGIVHARDEDYVY